MRAEVLNIANVLSGLRLVLAPILVYLAWTGQANLFLILLACFLLSDFIDGFIARQLKQTSELGSKLDSWGDFATYMTVPICAWWLWPELIRREAPFVILVVASYAVPVAVGFLKYGRLTSYHTWGAKISAVLIGSTTFLLLLGGPAVPFRIATLVLAIAEFEELAMTAILPTLQSNVPSFYHARQLLRDKDQSTAGKQKPA